jgi:hypothetical protein
MTLRVTVLGLGDFVWSTTTYASPPPGPQFFPNILFLSTTLYNWDDRHLLACAMASDFSVAWQSWAIVFYWQIFENY